MGRPPIHAVAPVDAELPKRSGFISAVLDFGKNSSKHDAAIGNCLAGRRNSMTRIFSRWNEGNGFAFLEQDSASSRRWVHRISLLAEEARRGSSAAYGSFKETLVARHRRLGALIVSMTRAQCLDLLAVYLARREVGYLQGERRGGPGLPLPFVPCLKHRRLDKSPEIYEHFLSKTRSRSGAWRRIARRRTTRGPT